MPHLREFQTRYAARGFNVVSVSSENEFEIEPYLEMNGVNFGVARAFGVGQLFGNTGVPHAWLINAAGVIVWDGHTNALTDADVNQALGAATASGATPSTTQDGGGDSWWIWLIICPAILFAGAMGWFLWSSRDRTAKYQTAYYPQQQYAPQPQAPPQQPYPPPQQYGQPQPYGQQPAPYGAPQPFPHPPESYPVQEPFQQLGYHSSPGSRPDTRVVGRPNSFGAHGSQESPGAAGKAEPPPIDQRPYLGQNPEFPPFDTNRNPPRNR